MSQAFFNLNIQKDSRYVTTFVNNNNYYRFKVLPFGLSVVPYFAQRFLNLILKDIRKSIKWSWGHIDDILIAHEDSEVLENIGKRISKKLDLAGWVLDKKKSV